MNVDDSSEENQVRDLILTLTNLQFARGRTGEVLAYLQQHPRPHLTGDAIHDHLIQTALGDLRSELVRAVERVDALLGQQQADGKTL